MKAVLLDAASLGNDVDLQPLAMVTHLIIFQTTSEDEIDTRIVDADIIITNKVQLTAAHLAYAKKLRLICVLATGINNVDAEFAAKNQIQIANVTNYGTTSVAQHTLMLMLALSAKLPLVEQQMRQGKWQQSPIFTVLDFLPMQLAEKQLGIIGQGILGRAVGQLATNLGMRVVYSIHGDHENKCCVPLTSLLQQSDIISLHCPLTTETFHILAAPQLALLQPHALLINCARGGIIDEVAALESLRANQLGGLAVDVLPQEPPKQGHVLLEALNEPLNLIVTPHIAWGSLEARQTIIQLTVKNIQNFLQHHG